MATSSSPRSVVDSGKRGDGGGLAAAERGRALDRRVVLRKLPAQRRQIRRRLGQPLLLHARAQALRERRGGGGETSRHGDGRGHQLLRRRVVALQLRGARGVKEERCLPLRIARGRGAAEVRLLRLRVLFVAEVSAPDVEGELLV